MEESCESNQRTYTRNWRDMINCICSDGDMRIESGKNSRLMLNQFNKNSDKIHCSGF